MLEHLQLRVGKTLDMISCVVVGSDLMESGPVGSMHRLARDVSFAC